MSTSSLLEHDVDAVPAEVAQQLRVDSVRCSAAASSGHPTSSMSAADLMAVLLARHLRYDFTEPDARRERPPDLLQGPRVTAVLLDAASRRRDRREEFLSYRMVRSRLEGHPTPRLPWVDVATGSLGQGLPIGVGVAIAGKSLDKLPYRVWVLCGDGELAEGSIWEAAEQAGCSRLDNLTVIVDVNRLGQRGPTRHGWDTAAYAARFRAFGWHTQEIDGHDIRRDRPRVQRRGGPPRAPLGDPGQDEEGPRGRGGRGQGGRARRAGPRRRGERSASSAACATSGSGSALRPGAAARSGRTAAAAAPRPRTAAAWSPPAYQPGSMRSTRAAFGEALAALGDARPTSSSSTAR